MGDALQRARAKGPFESQFMLLTIESIKEVLSRLADHGLSPNDVVAVNLIRAVAILLQLEMRYLYQPRIFFNLLYKLCTYHIFVCTVPPYPRTFAPDHTYCLTLTLQRKASQRYPLSLSHTNTHARTQTHAQTLLAHALITLTLLIVLLVSFCFLTYFLNNNVKTKI